MVLAAIFDFAPWDVVPQEIWETAKLNFPFLVSLTQIRSQNFVPRKWSGILRNFPLLYLDISEIQFNKNYYQVFYPHPRICETIKFHPKRKKKTWDQKCSIWVFLGIWTGMLKNYCHICNQRPPVCLSTKYHAKIRIIKFGAKNV